MKYERRACMVEAIQFTGDNRLEVIEWGRKLDESHVSDILHYIPIGSWLVYDRGILEYSDQMFRLEFVVPREGVEL